MARNNDEYTFVGLLLVQGHSKCVNEQISKKYFVIRVQILTRVINHTRN